MAKGMKVTIKQLNGPLLKHSIKFLIILFIISQLLILNLIEGIESTSLGNRNYKTPIRSDVGHWETLKLWDDADEFFTVAVGDVDHEHPGDEIVVAGDSAPEKPSKVTVVYGFGNTWVAETIFNENWWVHDIEIGDVYPPHPGNEILIVGRSTYVTMIYKSTVTNKWVSERIYHDYDWLFDIAIGDIDPNHFGNETAWVGDPRHVMMANYSMETNTWSSKEIWADPPDGMNVIEIGDFDPLHQGNEVAVSGANVAEIKLREISYNYSTGVWDNAIIGDVEILPKRMVIGEFYSHHPGDELALISIQKNVVLVHRTEAMNSWVLEKLWQDAESIMDLEIVDIDPSHPGNELIVAGNSKSVTLLMDNPAEPNSWDTRTILTTRSSLNGIAMGEFDSFHSGIEFAVIQTKGKLLRLKYEQSGFGLFTPQLQYSVVSGAGTSVPIIITSEGDFSSLIALSIINHTTLADSGINLEFDSESYPPPSLAILYITAFESAEPKEYEISISGVSSTSVRASQDHEKTNLSFILVILPSTTPLFNLTITPTHSSVVADSFTDFNVNVKKINDWTSAVSLNLKYLPHGISYAFDKSKLQPPQNAQLTITTNPAVLPDKYFLIIEAVASDDKSIYQTGVIFLEVKATGEPDFILKIEPNEVEVPINGSAKLNISGFSKFNFNETLFFTLQELPEFVSTQFSPSTFIPTGNTSLIITIEPDAKIGTHNVTIIGIGKTTGLQHSVYFQLIIIPEKPAFSLSLSPSKIITNVTETAKVELTFAPRGGFIGEINLTITGLTTDMTWNEDISPVLVDGETATTIFISDLNQPGEYELTIIGESEIHSDAEELILEILPEHKSDDSDVNNELLQIAVPIIILLIIIIILYLLTQRTSRSKKGD